MVDGPGVFFQDRPGLGRVQPGDQDVFSLAGHPGHDFQYLGGRFAFPVNHFRESLAQRAVVVNPGKINIFKRQMFKAFQRPVYREFTLPDLGEDFF